MKVNNSFPISRLREVFIYEPATGFLWRRHPTRRANVSLPCGSTDKSGYMDVCVDKHLMKAHRVVWALVHGHWPEKIIDHVNGVKYDNRIENLRLCVDSENGCNRGAQRNNNTGIKGVTKYENRYNKPFLAKITIQGKQHFLGYYRTKEAAARAYAAACRRLHGEFARVA
jgi:hypothetical protein